MVDKSMRLQGGPDSNYIILDIGLTYTKCGFSKDALPVHIVPTPLTMIQGIRDNINKVNAGTFANAFQNTKKLKLELEEFVSTIFYHLLQLNPKERSVVIIENLMSPRALIDSIAHVLLRSYQVRSVYFFLGNAMPLYASGVDTGLIVDCGFQQSQILPIVRSRLCSEAFEVCYAACGVNIEKEMNYNLVYDNKESFKAGATQFNEQGLPLFNFPKEVLEDLKVRSLVVMQREQRDEYLGSLENIEKMRKKKYSLGKQFKEFNNLQLSFYSRYCTMESCFGDTNEEEPNLAYSILKSIKKLNLDNRQRACQNIVLTGGSCIVPGFKTRLLQEMRYLVNKLVEFEEIRETQGVWSLCETCFPPNTMAWAGASILSQLNSEIDKFEITQKDYIEKYNQEVIPDRFGEAFLFGAKDPQNFFNKEFEEYMRAQKNMIFSSTTPYSTRSYHSKRDPILGMLQKTMQ